MPTGLQENEISTARWVLERQLSWIDHAEVKAGLVLTINLALISAFLVPDFWGPVLIQLCRFHLDIMPFLRGLIIATNIVACYCVCKVILAQTKSTKKSLIYFGEISKLKTTVCYEKDFVNAIKEKSFLSDLTSQIYINAKIATDKFYWVNRSITFTKYAFALFLCAVICKLFF